MKPSAKETLHKVKNRHNIGSAWKLTEHVIIEAMEEYAKQNENSTDLLEVLGKQTRETLTA